MNNLSYEQLQDLVDGKHVALNDNVFLRAKQEPDYYTTINDFEDCYGKIAPVTYSPYTGRARSRPDGFDGKAHIIRSHHSDPVWWQPPADFGTDPNLLNNTKNIVREILDFGFYCWVVEMCDGKDAYGNAIVRDYQSICGIEPLLETDDTMLIICDVVNELLATYDLDTHPQAC